MLMGEGGIVAGEEEEEGVAGEVEEEMEMWLDRRGRRKRRLRGIGRRRTRGRGLIIIGGIRGRRRWREVASLVE